VAGVPGGAVGAESFRFSTDSELVAKVTDVVGLSGRVGRATDAAGGPRP